MSETATVTKSGEQCIYVSLQRTAAGLTVGVKAHPRVEEFFKNIGDLGISEVNLISRTWAPVARTDDSLKVYMSRAELAPPGAIGLGSGSESPNFYTIDAIGRPLKLDNGKINLSFLRLVGISEGPGVSFVVKGVYSLENLRDIRERIGRSAKSFYIEYLRPIDISINISTMEMQL